MYHIIFVVNKKKAGDFNAYLMDLYLLLYNILYIILKINSQILILLKFTKKCANVKASLKNSIKYNTIKDFPKERYNTYAKSCNSNLYTKYPGATHSGLLLGTMRCL